MPHPYTESDAAFFLDDVCTDPANAIYAVELTPPAAVAAAAARKANAEASAGTATGAPAAGVIGCVSIDGYGTFRLNFHRFDRFELDLRGRTQP